jgi:hypothetical protein
MDKTKSKHYYETDRNLDNERQDNRVPEYYKGKNGYEARKVCDNFDLSYHIGTAVTYLLRSKRKHESPTECLQKAINHIQFEIENYEEKSRS